MLDDALEIVHVWGAMHACSNSHAAHALQRLLKRAPNPILLSRFTPESLEDFAEFTKMLATSLSKRGKCSHNLLLLAQQQQPWRHRCNHETQSFVGPSRMMFGPSVCVAPCFLAVQVLLCSFPIGASDLKLAAQEHTCSSAVRDGLHHAMQLPRCPWIAMRPSTTQQLQQGVTTNTNTLDCRIASTVALTRSEASIRGSAFTSSESDGASSFLAAAAAATASVVRRARPRRGCSLQCGPWNRCSCAVTTQIIRRPPISVLKCKFPTLL